MFLAVQELQKEPIHFDTAFTPGQIDYGEETAQQGPLSVEGQADALEEYRGPRDVVTDIRVRAHYAGRFTQLCARCLEPVECSVAGEIDLIFRPAKAEVGAGEHSINDSETEIGYYENDGLSLEDVLREQVLLSLPAKSLCREDCHGLCSHCGQNLNSSQCSCESAPADPRWTALSGLRSQLKSE